MVILLIVPKVLKVIPERGTMDGGTVVVVTVARLLEPETTDDILLTLTPLSGEPVSVLPSNFVYDAAAVKTFVEFLTPSMAEAGDASLLLSNAKCPLQQSSSMFMFYNPNSPVVLSQSAQQGPATGGTSVILDVSNLPDSVQSEADLAVKFGVSFGIVELLFPESDGQRQVKVSSPEYDLGSEQRMFLECILYVISAGEAQAGAFQFTYYMAGLPVVQRMHPTMGNLYGGSTLAVEIKELS